MTVATTHSTSLARRRWRVVGQVQGVGYRPFVYRLAMSHGLTGTVLNDSAGVLIEAQGDAGQLDRFARELLERGPALARVANVHASPVAVIPKERDFQIVPSVAGPSRRAAVAVDAALCEDCLRELLDPTDRRSRYGLINCTHCGPRYSIVRNTPYDRRNTTMASFVMCDECEAEYRDPGDRRFHAQPNACHDCGPRVSLVGPGGDAMAGDPYVQAARLLAEGRTLAIKGIGGFHLAVRADSAQAVTQLRERKQRDARPFAVMARDLDAAETLADIGPRAAALMRSPTCPIVLAPHRDGSSLAATVAPNIHRVGVMLPYTPIQHLLLAADPDLGPLVMTSANLSGEPLVIDNDEAKDRLSPLCDAMLLHDRPIERRVDDSVFIDMGHDPPLPLRRARGLVPSEIALPEPLAGATDGLCVGGELKGAAAVVRDGRVILSQHLGDLSDPKALEQFRTTIDDLLRLFDVDPKWIACDCHPCYLSRDHARHLAARFDAPLVEVQHHHAHAASTLAEHGRLGPALAVVLDGVGYGDDGLSWGGELLHIAPGAMQRLAHLEPLPLIGGDAAATDTTRPALALLRGALGRDYRSHRITRRLLPDKGDREMITAMLDRDIHCPRSTAAGRIFDGVAALLGVCRRNTFEAEAPMRLESLAAEASVHGSYIDAPSIREGDTSDSLRVAPLVRHLLDDIDRGTPTAISAAWFHDAFVELWIRPILDAAKTLGLREVALTGGVFCNERLTRRMTRRLESEGLRVLRHHLVPPNDGGLALGQAAVAAARHLKQRRLGSTKRERL